MNLKEMVQAIFSAENLAKVAEKTGLKADQVQTVMGKAMPFLANAENKDKSDEEAIRAISEEAGVPEGETKSVLTDMLPLMMGLLGGGSGGSQGGDLPGGSSSPADNGMMGMFSSLLGGMDSGGMDMGELFGGMLGGGGAQDLNLEQGPAPNPAPTVDQAFQQPVQQAAEEAQEEAQNGGGLLGFLGNLFGKK